MTATYEERQRWMQEAKDMGAKYIISVCDTFSYDDYPVYCMDKHELTRERAYYLRADMQTINEVIEL